MIIFIVYQFVYITLFKREIQNSLKKYNSLIRSMNKEDIKIINLIAQVTEECTITEQCVQKWRLDEQKLRGLFYTKLVNTIYLSNHNMLW